MNMSTITAKLTAGTLLSAEERTFLNAQLDAQAPQASAADLSALSPEVRLIVESAQAAAQAATAQAQQAQAAADHERGIRLDREFAQAATALGQPAAFGATLRAASESMTPEAYADLTEKLSAAAEQSRLTAVLGAGNSGASSSAQAASQSIEAKAQELIKGGMDPEKAYGQAMQGNASAAQTYSAEMRSGAPKV